MRKDYHALAGTDRGVAGAAQRLLGQRHAAVETLVAAVAKHALRKAMSVCGPGLFPGTFSPVPAR